MKEADSDHHNSLSFQLPPDIDEMIRPCIHISPFSYTALDNLWCAGASSASSLGTVKAWFADYLKRPPLLTRSGRHALHIVLNELNLKIGDIVTIFTSSNNWYVSSCVTKTIEQYCHWSMRLEPQTKVILVIHEWGIPHPRIREICSLGYPVIEDCAYSFASADEHERVGIHGQYAIYSLPKFFAVNFGGIACGLQNPSSVLTSDQEAFIAHFLISQITVLREIVEARSLNWSYLKSLFATVGTQPYFEIKPGWVPGVFMFESNTCLSPPKIKEIYQAHQIECSVFYGTRAVYIPCHQNLNKGSLIYMFSIYKDMLEKAFFENV